MSVPRKLSFGESSSRTEDVNSNNNRRSPNKKTSPPRHRLQHHHSAPAISTIHANENNANTNTSSSINSKLPNYNNNTNNNASTTNPNKKMKKQRDALHSSASGSSFPPHGNHHHHNAVLEAGAELYHANAVSVKQGPSAPDFEVASDPAAVTPLKTRPPSPNSVNSPTRWAGGAFHNSPPPSKLPVPAFSPKRKESNPAQSASPPPHNSSPEQYALPAEVQTAVSYWPGYPPHVPGPYGYAAGYGALPVYIPITSAPAHQEVQQLPVYMMPAVPAGNVPLAQISHDLRQMLNIRA